MDQVSLPSFLSSIARDGDIILPVELCVLRREETLSNGQLVPSAAALRLRVRRQVEACETSRSDWGLRAIAYGVTLVERGEIKMSLSLTGNLSPISVGLR